MPDNAVAAARTDSSYGADILAVGFGTSVAMWTLGYICRFPPGNVPSWILLGLLLACLVAGGFVAGRYTDRSWRGGLYTGLLAAVLNLLVLGSLLSGSQPNQIVPSALWWLPGSLLISALLGTVGGWLGHRAKIRTELSSGLATTLSRNAVSVFATVAASATFLLLVAGGIVTSNEAGLAVVDWPNSYGYNMFLYPLSRMSGGIYYEHVHRLLGSLVGLTILVLTIHLQRFDQRRWVRGFALAALAMVIIQGILGGLRVTGGFTMSSSPAETSPNLTLAMIHGVIGQLFFGMVVSLAVFTSRRWQDGCEPEIRPAAATDRSLSVILFVLLSIQLVLGAILRHMAGGLLVHISMAVIVILFAIAVGVRVWAQYQHIPTLRRLGNLLAILITVQLALGLAALIVTGTGSPAGEPGTADVILTTAHQACGAILLACSVALMLWLHRLVKPAA